MANPFLNSDSRDVETAILLEQANVTDIGNAVAYTDGNRIFMNTEDNLFTILPAYTNGMLKWLLWHEKMHLELRHHNRFFKYLKELDEEKLKDEFHVTKDEVNIIMDILVHDSLARMFPDLVETAVNNLAQMRNRNSLGYTFKTFTLEEMLKEYSDYKHKDEDEKGEGDGEGTPEETDEEGDGTSKGKGDKPSDEESEGKSEARTTPEKDGHGASGKGKDEKEPEVTDKTPEPDVESEQPSPEPEHDKTDWSKLDKIDSKEFIEKDEGDRYIAQIERLKRKKFRLAKLTQTLNGLATTTKVRSYRTPSTIQVGGGVILKGQTQGKTALYLCFDGSGSMGREMETFKEIISKSIPQAMDVPTTWFSGYCYRGSVDYCKDPTGRNRDYYKGKFKDFMKVSADSGYNDDGDRTIEMCWKAEQLGYSPIGVTDGGGQISWSKDMLKQLKRTVFVGQNRYWLEAVQKINPKVQILAI
jgi:hypothetical protein